MNKNRRVWQIGTGDAARPYADKFLQYGVGLIGPGDPGEWSQEKDDSVFYGTFVRRFAKEVDPKQDVFVLRTGQSRMQAVGIVAGPYEYLKQFDDVNDWDLQHARRVLWCKLPQEYGFGKPVFGANPGRFSRVWNIEVLDFVNRFLNSPPVEWQTASLPSLPSVQPEMMEVPERLRDMMAEVRDLYRLYWDRHHFGEHPREDEPLAHIVVPLLRRLGWLPECIAIKWRNVDVAVFRCLPRTPENCHFVIEIKRLGAGLEMGAPGQAQEYLRKLGVARDIVVTDGVRYRMHDCTRNFEPVAYANLTCLKEAAHALFDRISKP